MMGWEESRENSIGTIDKYADVSIVNTVQCITRYDVKGKDNNRIELLVEKHKFV